MKNKTIYCIFYLIVATFLVSSCGGSSKKDELFVRLRDLRMSYIINPNPRTINEIVQIVEGMDAEKLNGEQNKELRETRMFLFVSKCDISGLIEYLKDSDSALFAYKAQKKFYLCYLNRLLDTSNCEACEKQLTNTFEENENNTFAAMDLLSYYSMLHTSDEVQSLVDSVNNIYSNVVFATYDIEDYTRYRIFACTNQ